MTRPPFNLLAKPNKAGCGSADGLLPCICDRILVKINAAGQIETTLDWSINRGLEYELRDLPFCAARWANSFRAYGAGLRSVLVSVIRVYPW